VKVALSLLLVLIRVAMEPFGHHPLEQAGDAEVFLARHLGKELLEFRFPE